MRERATDLAALLHDANTCIHVCRLESMEEGAVLALRDIADVPWAGTRSATHSGARAGCTWRPTELLLAQSG